MQAKSLRKIVHVTFAAALLASAAGIAAIAAAKAVAEKYGLEFIPATGLGYGDVRPTLRELAEDGASLMIAHASGYNTAAPEVAEETKVPVAIVDRPDANKKGLVADYTLSGHEGAD